MADVRWLIRRSDGAFLLYLRRAIPGSMDDLVWGDPRELEGDLFGYRLRREAKACVQWLARYNVRAHWYRLEGP